MRVYTEVVLELRWKHQGKCLRAGADSAGKRHTGDHTTQEAGSSQRKARTAELARGKGGWQKEHARLSLLSGFCVVKFCQETYRGEVCARNLCQ